MSNYHMYRKHDLGKATLSKWMAAEEQLSVEFGLQPEPLNEATGNPFAFTYYHVIINHLM